MIQYFFNTPLRIYCQAEKIITTIIKFSIFTSLKLSKSETLLITKEIDY